MLVGEAPEARAVGDLPHPLSFGSTSGDIVATFKVVETKGVLPSALIAVVEVLTLGLSTRVPASLYSLQTLSFEPG